MSDESKIVKNSTFDDKLVGLRKHSEELNKLVVESLQGALLKLIKIKPYDSITVTELCKKAGVSRMAFYGNFSSKDDIFRRIVSDLHREMLAKIGSPFRQMLSEQWYCDLFKFLAEKSNVLQPIFCAGYHDKYLQLVNSLVLRHKEFDRGDTYLRLLWNGGMINSVAYWLTSGMKETPEQMATYCNRFFADFAPTCFLTE